MNRILKRIAKKILMIHPKKINEATKNRIINKENPDEIWEPMDLDPENGRIVTLDNGKIKDAMFLPCEYDEDGFELNHHDYILSQLEEKHNLPKDSLLARNEADSNVKLGFINTWKDNAFIFFCVHTNVNEVKDLILKYCPNIKNIYDNTARSNDDIQIFNSI